MQLAPNTQIGSYRIIRPLGEGGMGSVFEVEHVNLGVRYALKFYTLGNSNAELFRRRFAAEGKLLARLSHPNLVRVIDLDVDERTGLPYFVMELVRSSDGSPRSIADVRPGEADEDRILFWFAQLAGALDYIHSQGIVHRDIKPANILIAPDGHVVLSDFGISRIVVDDLRKAVDMTRTLVGSAPANMIVGTQGYLAPEVRQGEAATPAADVYALGVVFFKLLTGVAYDDNLEPKGNERQSGKTDAAKLLADFERPWKEELPALLAKDPAKRPTDLCTVARRLSQTAQPRPACREKPNANDAPLRRKIALGVLAALVLTAAALAFSHFFRHATDDDELVHDAFALPESVR